MAKKKSKAKSKKKGPASKPSTAASSESTVPETDVDHGIVDDTTAGGGSLWKRWDESITKYHGKACVMDWDLVLEASRDANMKSEFDRLNFMGCTKEQIDQIFPLVPGCGAAHPPCTTLISGALIREWRNASHGAQGSIRLSSEPKLQKMLAFLSGKRTDKLELGRLLLGEFNTPVDSSALSDSPSVGQEEEEAELQQVSNSRSFVKEEGNVWVLRFKQEGGSGRLSTSTAATEAETVDSIRRDFADHNLPPPTDNGKIDVTANDDGRFARMGDSGHRMLMALSRHLSSSASQTGLSRLQNDVVKIQCLLASFVHMRDKSPPSILGAVEGSTMAALYAASPTRPQANDGDLPAAVAAGEGSVATPDLDRLCTFFQEVLSDSSNVTRRLDEMFPYCARRIHEVLLAYPHVSTSGTSYRHLAPTTDMQSVLFDNGFDTRQTLHEMKIDLAALNVAFDCSLSATDDDDRTESGARDAPQAALVAWKEMIMFLGPRSIVSGGSLAVWLTKNAFLLAAGEASPLTLFGEEVLGCFGFCQHFHVVVTRRGIHCSWAGFAREPADPEELERVTDAIVRLLFLDAAVDHFCLLRDRNALLAPYSDLGTLSLVRQPRINAAAQDPVGGVLACMYKDDRKFHGMMKTFCACLTDVLGMGFGPPKLLLAADSEEQSNVEFPQLLDALSRSHGVKEITVLFPRGRRNGRLDRAWIDGLADALPLLDRLEEIHIQ